MKYATYAVANESLKFLPEYRVRGCIPDKPEVFSRFFWQLIFWSSSLQFLRFLSPTDIKKLFAFFPFSVLKENKFHSHDVHSQLKNLQVLQEAIAKLFGFEPGQITSLIS